MFELQEIVTSQSISNICGYKEPPQRQTESQMRAEFEAWINNPYMCTRLRNNGMLLDTYNNPTIQGAWMAWKYIESGDKGERK